MSHEKLELSVPSGRTREWASAFVYATELRDSLEEMLNAALEERLPSEEVRGRAFDVFLKAKGLA